MEGLDIKNESKKYLDEKELYILYQLRKYGRVSTQSCDAFEPKNKYTFHIPENADTVKAELEKFRNRTLNAIRRKAQSPVVLLYLLDLGKLFDPKGFSVEARTYYSLEEAGFLCEWNGHKHHPVKAYQDAILNKEAEPDFIALVNKLVVEGDDGKWNTADSQKFLDIYYKHNKARKIPFTDDCQTELAKLIFEHADFSLVLKNTGKLDTYLADYLGLFASDKLDGMSKVGLTGNFLSEGQTMPTPLPRQFFGHKKQRDLLVECITQKRDEYQREELEISNPYFEPKYIGDLKGEVVKLAIDNEDSKTADLFLFVHAILALEKEGYLEIERFFYGATEMFDMYDRGFVFRVKLNEKKIDTVDVASVVTEQNTAHADAVPSNMKITLGTFEYRKKKHGFLQLFARGERIRIGQIDTRQYRLARCLFSPENKATDVSFNPTFQGIDKLYTAISLRRDNVNSGLKSDPQNEKRKIITHAIKELQKIRALQGYITFDWSPDKSKLRMRIHAKEG